MEGRDGGNDSEGGRGRGRGKIRGRNGRKAEETRERKGKGGRETDSWGREAVIWADSVGPGISTRRAGPAESLNLRGN